MDIRLLWFGIVIWSNIFAVAKSGRRQNIILIIPDDLNTAISSLNDPIAVTPNLDKLYRSGVGFTNLHVGKSDCAPSRLALFAGRRVDALQVWDFKPDFRKKNKNLITFPQSLRASGYRTLSIGKNFDIRSFRQSEKEDLCVKGSSRQCSWDYVMNQGSLTGNSRKLCGAQAVATPGSLLYKSSTPMTFVYDDSFDRFSRVSCVTTHAIEKLKEVSMGYLKISNGSVVEKPFFLAVGYMATHLPWIVPNSSISIYENVTAEDFMEKRPKDKHFFEKQSQRYAKTGNSEMRHYRSMPREEGDRVRAYYASVTFLDAEIGKLLSALEQQDEYVKNNTIVAVWSDHGFHLGEQGLWGKKTNFDAATNAPFVIVPSRHFLDINENVSVGVKFNTPVQELDVFPTLLDMAGVPDAPRQERAGTSLVPVIRGEKESVRSVAVSQYWAFNTKSKTYMGYSLRTEKYRFTTYFRFRAGNGRSATYKYDIDRRGKTELYDYSKDGQFELLNRVNDPEYKSVVDMFESIMKSNSDSEWTHTLLQ